MWAGLRRSTESGQKDPDHFWAFNKGVQPSLKYGPKRPTCRAEPKLTTLIFILLFHVKESRFNSM